MKKIILLSLTILIVPQIVFAAWWNPFSWFNNWGFFHKTNTETQALENRVKELEKKLDDMATSTTITATSTDKTVSNTATTTATTTKIAVKTTVKPKTETSLNIKTETPKKVVKTFTLPSGAVIDDAGNIISPPTSTSQTSNTATNIITGGRTLSGEEIYSLISPSVVQVGGGGGTGFIVENGKYTITNEHVVRGYDSVTLKFYNGTTIKGPVLGVSEEFDIAIIYNNGLVGLRTVAFGSSDPSILKIGGDAYVLGYPLGSYTSGVITLTKGIISANKQVENGKNYIQTDATTHPGNSGGPVVNNKGEVVGVHARRGSLTETSGTGVALSIPIETAKNLIPTLSQYGQSRYEVYPIGSTQTISRSAIIKIGFNEALPCTQLGFTGNDLTICNLYKDHYKDYQWNIKENL